LFESVSKKRSSTIKSSEPPSRGRRLVISMDYWDVGTTTHRGGGKEGQLSQTRNHKGPKIGMYRGLEGEAHEFRRLEGGKRDLWGIMLEKPSRELLDSSTTQKYGLRPPPKWGEEWALVEQHWDRGGDQKKFTDSTIVKKGVP